ncbi:MAG: hypothetical protein JWP19_2702 [Rhodoglobus sp.]|nr:hypothetical protein [Rhodoglobus sp.]
MPARLEVAVFTYNHESFIERALQSVLDQSTDFEIAIRIHDDASTDGTVERITGLLSGASISWELVVAPVNRYQSGIYYYYEFIAASRAEFVAILDGDDFWLDQEKLQRQVDALDRLPSAAICHHPVLEFVSGELKAGDWPPARYRTEILPGSALTEQNVISTSSVVLRADWLPRPMPEGFNDLRVGDYPLWSLTAAGHDLAFIDRPMSAYRIHDTNIWASLTRAERFDREVEARIFISSHVPSEFKSAWRLAMVGAIGHHLEVESRAREKIANLESDLRDAREETNQLRASTSWKLTKPLRTVMRTLARRIANRPNGG